MCAGKLRVTGVWLAAWLFAGCQVVSGLSGLDADGLTAGVGSAGVSAVGGKPGLAGRSGSSSVAGAAGPTAAAGKGAAGAAVPVAVAGSRAGGAGDPAQPPVAGTSPIVSEGGRGGGGAGGSTMMMETTAGKPAPSDCAPPSTEGETCDNAPQCGCSDITTRCVFAPDAQGRPVPACRRPGAQALYAACSSTEQDCELGYQCSDGVCLQPCDGPDAACGSRGTACIQAYEQAVPVNGLFVCSQDCSVSNSKQNDGGFHACTDGYVCRIGQGTKALYSHCERGTRNDAGTMGKNCSADSDCAEGHFCSQSGWCNRYCQVGGDECAAQQTCTGLAGKLVIAGNELGYCACPAAEVAPNGPCNALQGCGCRNGDKCDITTPDGATACVAAGGGGVGASCVSTQECASGSSCYLGTCHALCAPDREQLFCQAGKCRPAEENGTVASARFFCSGGLLAGCTDFLYDGTILSAQCMTRAGTTLLSSIDLNMIVGNNDGTLTYAWPVGLYGKSCMDSSFASDGQTARLTATCVKADQTVAAPTSVDLNEHIANVDGVLVYN